MPEVLNAWGDKLKVHDVRTDYGFLVTKTGTTAYHYNVYLPTYNPEVSTDALLYEEIIFYDKKCYKRMRYDIPNVPKDLGNAYRMVRLAMCKHYILKLFPEIENELYLQEDYTFHTFKDKKIRAYLLDLATSQNKAKFFHGWKVKHDVFGTGIFNAKSDPPRIRWRGRCGNEFCNKKISFMTTSGCHAGAWCYVCDKDGTYLADLRNQYIICSDCSKKRRTA